MFFCKLSLFIVKRFYNLLFNPSLTIGKVYTATYQLKRLNRRRWEIQITFMSGKEKHGNDCPRK